MRKAEPQAARRVDKVQVVSSPVRGRFNFACGCPRFLWVFIVPLAQIADVVAKAVFGIMIWNVAATKTAVEEENALLA